MNLRQAGLLLLVSTADCYPDDVVAVHRDLKAQPRAPGESPLVLPADSGIVDVTQDPYRAKGDGITDDTAALRGAIRDNVGKNKILWLPPGIYLVSDTLDYRDAAGLASCSLTLQGAGEDQTVLRLTDRAAGYGDVTAPKALIRTNSCYDPSTDPPHQNEDGSGNRGIHNSIADLTVDVGEGNAGAIGIDYLANYRSAIRRVTVRSSDRMGLGRAALLMQRYGPGPALLDHLTLIGFAYGIDLAKYEYGITLEHARLSHQNVAGIRNVDNLLAIRDLSSTNAVPALQNGGGGHVTLLDARLEGGSGGTAAIENDSSLYARDLASTGYAAAIVSRGVAAAGSSLPEYMSDPARHLFESAGSAALSLQIADPPPDAADPVGQWHAVPLPNGSDDTASIQAALDSGASTVYFRSGTYHVSATLHVPGAVRHLVGMEALFRPSQPHAFADAADPRPLLRFEGDTTEPCVLERIAMDSGDWGAGTIGIEHASPRPLAIRDAEPACDLSCYRGLSGAGALFLDDVAGGPWAFEGDQHVWARQLTAQGGAVRVTNAGAVLWILGFKSEGPATGIDTRDGGKTELLGGLLYPLTNASVPAFVIRDAQASLGYVVTGNSGYPIHVRETRGTETRELPREGLPPRGQAGANVTLYVGF